ncbi:MAG: hypothetical protein M1818_000871 [Claussenomyces sp. TS43310]|nr:MAG: hypothetical protein M1818_000871 [Claussenomyces sp. TS43310]
MSISSLPSTSDVPISSSAKRRKLNIYESSGSRPKALQTLKSAIEGVVGRGKRDENAPDTLGANNNWLHEVDDDEQSGEGELVSDVESTENDEDEFEDRGHRRMRSTAQSTKEATTYRDIAYASRQGQQEGLYATSETETSEEGDELAHKEHPRAFQENTHLETPTKRKLTRHNRHVKSGSTRTTSAGRVVDDTSSADVLSQPHARSSGRERKKPRRYSQEMVDATRSVPKSTSTPTESRMSYVKKKLGCEVGGPPEGEVDLGFWDVSRSRRETVVHNIKNRNKGTSTSLQVDVQSQEGTDLIGSPSASSTNNTTDNQDTQHERLRTGNTSNKSKVSSTKKRDSERSEDLVQSDGDDIKCVSCGNGDSDEPNEIILCDKCDRAYHQACYNVFPIPEGDWICRQCQYETIDGDGLLVCHVDTCADIDGLEHHLRMMQELLLDKLTGRRRLELLGLNDEYAKVHQVVEQTVLAGEGNSILVIGARGSGKTTLVESVVGDLSKDHRHDFHVIRLNGFIHTDDRLALREIWRQLGREMDVEDELTSKTSNRADTLASLLALLSHPSEISEVEANLAAKSVIFILDEFDLFASHPRQTLLYNLFDISQARKAPIAVLGMTTKVDVVETLEKRVKSRFSHRYVHLSRPKNMATFWEICRQGLVIDTPDIVKQGLGPSLGGQQKFLSYWNAMVDKLYSEDPYFRRLLVSNYMYSKSVSAVFRSCIIPISRVNVDALPLTGALFSPEDCDPSLSPPDSKLHLLEDLAELDLAMLIAAARLDIILDTDTCNFAMAYDQYSSLTSRHKIQTSSTGIAALGASAKVWGREVAIGSWERLIDYELLVPTSIGGMSVSGRENSRDGKMWKVDVTLEEIADNVELNSVLKKWCRAI